jgi:hypothetical protein
MPMLGQTSSRRSFARINPDMPAGEIVSDFENRTSNVLSISCVQPKPGDFAAAGHRPARCARSSLHRASAGDASDGQRKHMNLL